MDQARLVACTRLSRAARSLKGRQEPVRAANRSKIGCASACAQTLKERGFKEVAPSRLEWFKGLWMRRYNEHRL